MVSAHCNELKSDVSIHGQTIIVKVGHSWCLITVEIQIDSEPYTFQFHPQKLNNWNRISYIPVDSTDPLSEFTKFENGVEKPNHDFTRK